MFKCVECGQKFDIKPDYCDCGNDVFEEIIAQEQVVSENKISEKINKDNFEKQEPVKVSLQHYTMQDYVSVGVFLICIILSILSIMFLGNTSSQTVTQPENKPKPVENIPSISELWVAPKPEVKEVEQPVEKQIVQLPKIITDNFTKKPANNNPKTTTVQKKATSNPAVKPKTTPKTPTQQPKPIQSSTQTTQTAKPVQTTKPAQTTQATSTTQTNQTTQKNQTAQTSANTTTQTSQTSQPTQPVAQKPTAQEIARAQAAFEASMKQELSKYKIQLRNKIASRINFLNVTGDGTCAVTFKLDSKGNLINRAFVQQSPNDTLNDAVYKAMMNTTSFTPPPSGYRNETLKLVVKIYNDDFEVSLN